MIGVILATHGDFANGLVDSANMFTQNADNIKILPLKPDTSLDSYFQEAVTAIDEVDQGDGILALVDIYGGSPSNTIFRAKNRFKKNVKIVTGVNLPMMVTLLTELDENTTLDELTEQIVSSGTENIKIME